MLHLLAGNLGRWARQGSESQPIRFFPDTNIDQQISSSNDSSEDEDDNDEIDVCGVQAMDVDAAATATELLVQAVNNLPLVPLLSTLHVLFQMIHKHSCQTTYRSHLSFSPFRNLTGRSQCTR